MAVDPAHAFAAAAGHRLDQHRVADLVSFLLEEFRLLPIAVIARHDRHSGLLHQRLGAALEAHGAYRRRVRPDESNASIDTGLREIGVLRKETVAGVDAFRVRGARSGNQFVDAQIAVGRRRRTDRMRLVAKPHMQCVRVGLGIDRDGAQAQPLGGAGDATGDFAAIGDQDGFEHE